MGDTIEVVDGLDWKARLASTFFNIFGIYSAFISGAIDNKKY